MIFKEFHIEKVCLHLNLDEKMFHWYSTYTCDL